MPVYEYECEHCRQLLEDIVLSADEGRETLACPVCGHVARRVISTPAAVLHEDSAWYHQAAQSVAAHESPSAAAFKQNPTRSAFNRYCRETGVRVPTRSDVDKIGLRPKRMDAAQRERIKKGALEHYRKEISASVGSNA